MQEHLELFAAHLKAAVERCKEELRGIRSGRPSPELFENIRVNAYGEVLRVKELGSISVRPPREVMITVWDQNLVGAVGKAIEAAKIGANPSTDGNIVRAALPPLSTERRKELEKLVGRMAEETRIRVRTFRDEINKKVKTIETDEDKLFKAKEKVQKLVDEANKEIEAAVENKLKELKE